MTASKERLPLPIMYGSQSLRWASPAMMSSIWAILGGSGQPTPKGRARSRARAGRRFIGGILVTGPRLCYYSAPMTVRAILFDLDGVLVDSYEVWFHLLNAV